MASLKLFTILATLFVLSASQRPFYAGLRPIGYPEAETNNILANRFGEDVPGPIEARGDGDLVNRLNKQPVDKRPFWLLNWQAYDELRNKTQTWPLRPNSFVDSN